MAAWLRELAVLTEDLVSVPNTTQFTKPVTPVPRDLTLFSAFPGHLVTPGSCVNILSVIHTYSRNKSLKTFE